MKMALFRSAIGAFYLKALSSVNTASFSEDDTARSIAEFLQSFKVKKPQNTIVSFPRNAVTLRNLRIPSIKPNEIDDMIKLHVGRQVPYAKEEIVSGYRVIGKDTMGYSKVMLAIVHRESIRKVFRILEKAGLYTDRVELSSDGALSWLGRAAKPADIKAGEAFIILDIDSAFTDFIVSTSENIVFSRVIALGSEGLSDESKWPKFIGEIKQTIVISQGEEVLQKPARIFISGAVDKLKALAAKVEFEFNLPAQTVEPLANLALAKEVEKRPADMFSSVSFSGSLGLGLEAEKKKINFVLPEAQIRKALRERGREMIFLASGIMYVILIVCGIYLEKMHNRQAYLGMLKSRHEKIAEEAGGLNEKMERIKRIKAKLDTRFSSLNCLYEISKLMPPEIVLVNLNFQKDDKVNIKGQSREMSDVFKFITILEGSSLFKDVSTRYTTRKKLKDNDIIEFELVCPVEGAAKSGAEKKAKDESQEK